MRKELLEKCRRYKVEKSDLPTIERTVSKYSEIYRGELRVEETSFVHDYLSSYRKFSERKRDPAQRPVFLRTIEQVLDVAENEMGAGQGLSQCVYFFGIEPGRKEQDEDIKKTRKTKKDNQLKKVSKDKKPKPVEDYRKYWNTRVPLKTIELWGESLNHLQEETGEISKNARLIRYISISKSLLSHTNSSCDRVLELLAERGQIYGAENILFGLLESRKLSPEETSVYFNNFKTLSEEERNLISALSSKTGHAQTYSGKLYDFLFSGNTNENSRRSMCFLLEPFLKWPVGVEAKLDKVISPMSDLFNRAPGFAQASAKYTRQVLEKERFSEDEFFPAYYGALTYISTSARPLPEKTTYARMAQEIFVDYFSSDKKFRSGDFSADQVKDKCVELVRRLSDLDDQTRETIIDAVYQIKPVVDKTDLLFRKQKKLRTDELVESVLGSYLASPQNASYFLNAVVPYKK